MKNKKAKKVEISSKIKEFGVMNFMLKVDEQVMGLSSFQIEDNRIKEIFHSLKEDDDEIVKAYENYITLNLKKWSQYVFRVEVSIDWLSRRTKNREKQKNLGDIFRESSKKTVRFRPYRAFFTKKGKPKIAKVILHP